MELTRNEVQQGIADSMKRYLEDTGKAILEEAVKNATIEWLNENKNEIIYAIATLSKQA
jgi:hypothetical protein